MVQGASGQVKAGKTSNNGDARDFKLLVIHESKPDEFNPRLACEFCGLADLTPQVANLGWKSDKILQR
jgi:hypothetical protein